MKYRIDQYNGSGVEGTPEQIVEAGNDRAIVREILRSRDGAWLEWPLYGYGDKPRPAERFVAGRKVGADGWIQIFAIEE